MRSATFGGDRRLSSAPFVVTQYLASMLGFSQAGSDLGGITTRVVVFRGLEIRPAERAQRVLVRVKLTYGEREAEAEEKGPDTLRNRVEAAARATAACLDELVPDNSLALEGAQLVEAFERRCGFVAVHGLGGRVAPQNVVNHYSTISYDCDAGHPPYGRGPLADYRF